MEYLMDRARKRLLDLIVVMKFALKYWAYLTDQKNLVQLFVEELANIVTPTADWKNIAKREGFNDSDSDQQAEKSNSN